MCRLAVIQPVVWQIRLDRLIHHLNNNDLVQYEMCSVNYRTVDVGKVACFSKRFVDDILHELFEIELLVGLMCGKALEMLCKLKEKVQNEHNDYKLSSLLSNEETNDESLGSIAMLPMLARVKVAEYLVV
jgi:hypothetical protein